MYEIDRMAAIIRPSQKFVEWVNDKVATENDQIKLENLQGDCTVILIPVFDNVHDADDYIESMYTDLFENELEAWCLDEDRWPQKRNYELFQQWFHIEFHSFVYDSLGIENNDEGRMGSVGGTTLQ